jgi:hypothetical protein
VTVDESVKTIENTRLYRSLAEGRTDVEIWDDNYSEDRWAYFSIVAFSRGTARKLAYVRVKGKRMQKRAYDENGDDQWVEAD